MTAAEQPDPARPPQAGSRGLARTVTRIVELLATAPTRAGTTRVLAIDGRSGAGKTTLSTAVAQALTPHPPVVHLESFYPGWDGLADGAARLLDWVLRPLATGGRPGYRRYDWPTAQYAEWIDVPPAPVLIVEGVGAGSLAGADHLSLLVYLDTPQLVRFERAMARDGETYRPHWQRWAEQEHRLLLADDPRGRADLVADIQLDTQNPGVG